MRKLIRAFVRHPVAPNLAMLVMIIAGIWATGQLTRQLLPRFAVNVIEVSVSWPGASAEDVEASVTQPIEDQLLALDGVRAVRSKSRDGQSTVSLDFPDNADMGNALDAVQGRVVEVRNLPATSEEPRIARLTRSEKVSAMLVAGPVREQLRPLVKRLERELRAQGLTLLEITGLPEQEIAIDVPGERLNELRLSLGDIGDRVRRASRDVPAGTLGATDVARQLRSLDQQRSVAGFEKLPIAADNKGQLIKLGDIAEVKRQSTVDQPLLFVNGKPAVEIRISRSDEEDSLDVADKLYAWMDEVRETLPPNVELYNYEEPWRTVADRIDLMISNAVSGLLLVAVTLWIFLNGRVAFWVAVGIPVSILASLVVLYLFGGSINIMTLFAMIMTLGIIVDDAIVVGEEAVTLYQQGASPSGAAEKAAFRMFTPVVAASITTVAAFLPLITIGGPTGRILFAIPLIVICVILASLVECFLVLPGHLRHSLQGTAAHLKGKFRKTMDTAFIRFREQHYRKWATWSVENRSTTISLAIGGLVLIAALLIGGRVGFSYFPQPEGSSITANVRFAPGSPEERAEAYLIEVEQALRAIEAESGESFIRLIIKKLKESSRGQKGSHLGHLIVEVLPPGDQRSMTLDEIGRQWRRRVPRPPGLETFLISGGNAGPPGYDIEIEQTGADAQTLKLAALDVQEALREFEGVGAIRDDTTYGKEQLIFELSSTGRALGLTSESLGEQLRLTYEGDLVQVFQDQGDEVEVRVRLAERERDTLRTLETLPIVLPDGGTAALASVAKLKDSRGFDTLIHRDGLLAVTVTADVDFSVNNANAVRGQMARHVLPDISQAYGVAWTFRGDAENQAESVGDLTIALPMSLMLIYIILAWVFASYSWPLAVLSVIPFGLVGAIFGHWLLGFDVTMLSIFGFFGLSGIVINDSIILVVVFKELRRKGMAASAAAVEAGCRRLRAVLLTSVTTVVGVAPLLFETALQAQFLKPMVISISFGLIFGTSIVLFLLPAFLVGIENQRAKFTAIRSRFQRWPFLSSPASVLAAGTPHAMTATDPTTLGEQTAGAKQ